MTTQIRLPQTTISFNNGIGIEVSTVLDSTVLDLSFDQISASVGSPAAPPPLTASDEIIVNNSGTIVKVTLQNLADWLTGSP